MEFRDYESSSRYIDRAHAHPHAYYTRKSRGQSSREGGAKAERRRCPVVATTKKEKTGETDTRKKVEDMLHYWPREDSQDTRPSPLP